MKFDKLDKIIKENIDRYVDGIIKESAFGYVTQNEPMDELVEYIKSVGSVTFNLNGEYDFSTPSYDWTIEYKIDPYVHSTYDGGSYDEEPSYELHGEDDFVFNVFEIYCFTKDGSEVPFETTDTIENAFRNIVNIDYEGYDIPSDEEYFEGRK